ncbi:MAG TPA: transposase [Polyangiaceae bacterium]|nr:transposase [Polyangiaceae bacterium]
MAYDVYRKFELWLKKKGLMRLGDSDETYESEDALASCLRGSVGIGRVVELDEAGDVQYSQQQADEKRFALRNSPHTGEFGGFSIHAGVTVHAADKDGRERLIPYCARPALSMERMCETSDGLIAYRLRHAQKGRATHRVMRPIDLLARIAALVPPPRHPLLRYFGVFGPHSSWRKLCVPAVGAPEQTVPTTSTSRSPNSATATPNSGGAKASPTRPPASTPSVGAAVNDPNQPSDPSGQNASPTMAAGLALSPWRINWATLLKRTYDFDVLKCPCSARLKALELVTDTERAKELLEQSGISAKPPPIARARSPDWD